MIVRPVYIESTNPVIELPREARQSSGWHPKERIDLVRGELDPDLEARAGRVPEEVSPETGISEQPTQRPLHVALTHVCLPDWPSARIAPAVFGL